MHTAQAVLGYVIINLDPIALHLGPLAIRWYGLAYVLAIAVALWATLRYADALGVPRDAVWQLFLWAAVAGLIGGRLYFDIQQPDFVQQYLLHPLNLIAVWQGGMAYFGAIFVAAPTIAILAWRAGLSPWLALDMAGLFGAVGQMFGRLGNLVNGDIVGYPVSHPVLPAAVCAHAPCIAYVADPQVMPWATAYVNPGSFIAQQGVPYQPAAAYEIIINLIALAILWPLRLILPRQVRAGAFFSLYVAFYALGQFVVFFARSNVFVSVMGIDSLKQAQWTALVTLVGIVLLYLLVVRRFGRVWTVPAAPPGAVNGPVTDTPIDPPPTPPSHEHTRPISRRHRISKSHV